VLLRVLFQPPPSAVVAHQESITSILSSHHRIIVSSYFGFLDILDSNPSLDQFFVTSASHKTNGFFASLLHNYQSVLVNCHTFFFQFTFISSGIPFLFWRSVFIARLFTP
jgi:hypothetical protein